jgi:hypothetical protein
MDCCTKAYTDTCTDASTDCCTNAYPDTGIDARTDCCTNTYIYTNTYPNTCTDARTYCCTNALCCYYFHMTFILCLYASGHVGKLSNTRYQPQEKV